MKVLMLAAALGAPTPPRPCLTQGDAEAVSLVALPEIIRQTGIACAADLPAASLLRRPQSAMLARYDAEAARAWPAARGAVIKLSGPSAEALLGSDFARPLLTTLIAPLIVGRVATKDCATIDRLVTAITWLQAQKPRTGANPIAGLPLCPAAAK